MRRPRLTAVAWLFLSLALGVMAAVFLNHALEIEFGAKSIPADGAEDLLPRAAQIAAKDDGGPVAISHIVVPAGFEDNPLLQTATGELAASVEERTGRRPAVLGPRESGAGDSRVLEIAVSVDPGPVRPAESYTLSLSQTDRWVVSSEYYEGAARGVFRVADAVRSGLDETQLRSLFNGRENNPAYVHRLVDLGGVGITPDAVAWRLDDYSHNNLAFAGMALADPPYVDPTALAGYEEQLQTYLSRMASYGYNGVVFEGFLQFIDFDEVGSGSDVYPAESPYRVRHEALRRAYARLFQYADSLGFDVYLYTDMLALTTSLQRYFEERLGGIDAEDPRLWEAYGLGLEELFERFPILDGLMIRVGEAGSVYNRPDWDYWSTLAVRSKEAVQLMLRELSGSAAKCGKEILFRSWSVGLGEVGTMHTDPVVYEDVLGPLDAVNLLVSTKFVQGDFESFLPLNPTLFAGGQRRVIELQARREYEGFSAFPNYLARVHQTALQTARSPGSAAEGVWVWTQMGGPLRAGPMSLYPFSGPCDPIDANVYATARLAWDPDVDLAQVTVDWVRRTYGPRDRSAGEKLAQLVLESHEVAIKGMYVSDYARRLVLATGRDAEAVGRLFQWDILNGSISEMGLVYRGLSQGPEAAIREGFAALEQVRGLLGKAQSIAPDQVVYPARLAALQDSLRYELSMFEVLAWYRETFLSYQRWLDAGRPADLARWRIALAGFKDARAQHLSSYGGSVEFPPLNLFAADQGLAHAERGVAMAWAARIWLVVTGILLMVGGVSGRAPVRGHSQGVDRLPFAGGIRNLFLGAFLPWRLSAVQRKDRRSRPSYEATVAALAPILVLLGVSIFSSFLSPSLLLLTTLLLVAVWAPVMLANLYSPGPAWAAIAGPQLLVTGLVLVPVAVRGPLFFWQGVLLDQTFRSILLPLFVLFALWPAFALYAFHRHSHNRYSALAHSSVAVGMAIAVAAVAAFFMGTEEAVSRINDELAILPFALSRTLGLSTHLNVSDHLALFIAVAAADVAFITSAAAWLLGKCTRRSRGAG